MPDMIYFICKETDVALLDSHYFVAEDNEQLGQGVPVTKDGEDYRSYGSSRITEIECMNISFNVPSFEYSIDSPVAGVIPVEDDII